MSQRWLLPLVVLLLLVIAGLIADQIDPWGVKTQRPAVSQPIVFPRDRPPRRPRLKTPARGAVATESTAATNEAPASLDRFERAIAASGPVIVAEVSAIRHSPLAEALLRCRSQDVARAREELEELSGIDLLEDVDRVMLGENTMVASGFFEDLTVPVGFREEAYGDDAAILSRSDDPSGTDAVLARAGKDLLISGPSRAAVEAAIDRVEGRQATELPSALLEGGAEIFGPLSGPALERMLSDSPLAALSSDVEQATFRAVVEDHVAFSLDFEASNPAAAAELLDMAKGGLSAARVEAARRGDQRLVSLLRNSRLVQDGARLAIDLSVPGDLVLETFECPPLASEAPPKSP